MLIMRCSYKTHAEICRRTVGQLAKPKPLPNFFSQIWVLDSNPGLLPKDTGASWLMLRC